MIERRDSAVVQKNYNKPTPQEVKEARQAMAWINRDWDAISLAAKTRLAEMCDLREFAIFPYERCRFHAILFLPTEADAAEARTSQLDLWARSVLLEIIHPLRAECGALDIQIEIDSDENVRRRYGSYFNRLR